MNLIAGLKQYIIKSRRQIIKFLIVGFSSALLDVGLLIILKEKANFHPVWAVAVNQIFIIAYNFLLNKYWSFETSRQPIRQFGRYVTLVIFNYFLSISLMYWLYDVAGMNYKLVRIFSIGLLFIINFIIYKHWVYKEI